MKLLNRQRRRQQNVSKQQKHAYETLEQDTEKRGSKTKFLRNTNVLMKPLNIQGEEGIKTWQINLELSVYICQHQGTILSWSKDQARPISTFTTLTFFSLGKQTGTFSSYCSYSSDHVMYIPSYMLKSEKLMTDLLGIVLKEKRREELRKQMQSCQLHFSPTEKLVPWGKMYQYFRL